MILRQVVGDLDLEHDQVFSAHMIKSGRFLRRLLRLGYLGWWSKAPADAAAPATSAELIAAQQVAPFVAELERRVAIRPVLETRTAFRETRLADVVEVPPNEGKQGLKVILAAAVQAAFYYPLMIIR